MNIPSVINIGIASFPTYYLLILLLMIVALFFIWFEGIRDGFDYEKMFDLFFLTLLVSVLSYFVSRYYAFYNFYLDQHTPEVVVMSTFFGFMILAVLFTKRWKWSIYRVFDIFSIYFFTATSVLFAFDILASQKYLNSVYLLLFVVSFVFAFINRNKLFSGVLFTLLLLVASIFGQFFYRESLHLIFYFALITISMVNLFFRTRKSKHMFKKSLNMNFIKKIRDSLKSKEKRLEHEQQRLIEDDPYLKEGREVGNAEAMDEAILEDHAKEEIEIKKKNIGEMQQQVEKALDKIEKGDYGICEVCGNAIEEDRLEVYPEATVCMSCASKAQ